MRLTLRPSLISMYVRSSTSMHSGIVNSLSTSSLDRTSVIRSDRLHRVRGAIQAELVVGRRINRVACCPPRAPAANSEFTELRHIPFGARDKSYTDLHVCLKGEDVRCWPFTSVRCDAAIFPESRYYRRALDCPGQVISIGSAGLDVILRFAQWW